MSSSELACAYAAMILYDDGIPITKSCPGRCRIYGFRVCEILSYKKGSGVEDAEKIVKLVKAAHVEVESYWPGLFAKLLEKRSVDDLILNVGSGGGGAAAIAAPTAGGAAPAAAAAPVEEKKEEPKEESDEDMGFSLFD